MNLSLLSPAAIWQLLGWTMIFFLAAGTVVLLIGGALRLSLRRANPSIRYATSLATFGLLALAPIVIAGYLASLPPLTREAHVSNATRQRGELTTKYTNDTKVLLNEEFAKNADVAEQPIPVATEIAEGAERIDPINLPGITTHTSIDFESLLNLTAIYLPWLWCIGTPFTFLLLATGLIGAERLRKSCQILNDGPLRSACDELQKALRIGRRVGVAVCDSVATPLLVGVVKPLILLPPAALNGWTTAELEMVLVHELAHVRRWDNAVNLGQRIVESLLFFHPAVWIVSNWVRRDREDCCDAAVVRHTATPQAYAELLLALASHQPLAGLAATAMAQHPVASRIRRILKLEDEPMLITRKGLTIGVSTVVLAALLAFALPTTDAEEPISRETERVADERGQDERAETTNPTRQRGEVETTKDTNNTKEEKDLTTEDTESTEKKSKDKDSVQYSVVYAVGENEAEIKSLLEAIEQFSDRVKLVTKGGKQMAVVTGTRASHEKLGAMFQSVRGEVGTSKFPTLEEQRAADLAYKLLGVELEKLTPEELERVKAKGYEGGVQVHTPTKVGVGIGNVQIAGGDLLVGLHVWPTESLKQVTEILNRDDLDQLSPLKFYVLKQAIRETKNGTGEEVFDIVSIGRVEVDLDAWRAMRKTVPGTQVIDFQTLEATQRQQAAGTLFESDSTLLYDGKTFDEWRSLWKTELKTEKRIECIKALAAFGRAGKGQEAAEAIFDVAGEYDFSPNPGGFGDDSAEGKLKEQIMDVLTDYPKHLAERDWLPVLQDRLSKEPAKYRGLTAQMLPRLVTSDTGIKSILSKLQQSDDQAVRQAALSAIFVSREVYTDAEKEELIKTVLESEPVTAIKVLDQRLLNYVSIEQAVDYLLSDDAAVQLAARRALRMFFDEKKGPELADKLLSNLNSAVSLQNQLTAIRALAALRSQAKAAEPALTKIIESTENEELMIGAVYAREMVTLGKGQLYRPAITEETENAIKKSKRWSAYLSDESRLKEAFWAETKEVIGEQHMMGGAGGMGGGGGMF